MDDEIKLKPYTVIYEYPGGEEGPTRYTRKTEAKGTKQAGVWALLNMPFGDDFEWIRVICTDNDDDEGAEVLFIQ